MKKAICIFMILSCAKLTLAQCPTPVLIGNHTSETEAILNFHYPNTKDTITVLTTEWKKKTDTNWNVRQGSNVTTISNLSPNTEYVWRAQVTCKNNGNSLYSTTQNFFTQCSPIISTGYFGDGLPTARQVGWHSLKTVDGYVVRWRKIGISNWSESPSIKATTNYTTYIISGLQNGNYYEFQIKAVCNGKSTDYVNIVPQSFKAECERDNIGQYSFGNVQTNSARISWGRTFLNLSTTEVHWRKVGDSQWTIIDKLQATFYDFKNLSPNTEYEVRLRKICEAGIVSDFSNTVVFKTLACPTIAKPTLSSNKTINSFCQGQSVTLSAASCAGTVKWENGQTGNSITVSPTANATYSAICESNGCTSQSQNIALQIYKPTVNISGKSEFCVGSNTTLMASPQNASGTVSYQWKLNSANISNNQNSLTANQAGSYIVEMTDGQGCTAQSAAFSLTEKGTEIVANITPAGTVSVYAPDRILLSATLGKEYSYQWQKDKSNVGGATNSVYEATQSGSYAVVVKHESCSRTSEAVNVRIEIPLATLPIQDAHFKVFPNPTNGKVQVQFGRLFKVVNLQLTDYQGLIIQKCSFNNVSSIDLDLSNYAEGIYFLQIKTETNTQTLKLMKMP
jgi:hypothetical protein